MRWKLLVLVSVIAAALALVLWSAVAIALFGSARVKARNDWILFVSLLIPFIISIFAGFFVYRHTASRRKSQALIATVLVIILTAASYVIFGGIFVSRLGIPRTYDVRHAR